MALYDPQPRTVAGTFGCLADTGDIARALERFRAKCRFDPRTGCVIWTGGRTRGRGNTAEYGSFWFDGRRWFAHRWSGVFIHRLDLDGKQAGHNCPHTPDGHPDTLCVQHVTGQTQAENLDEQRARGSGVCGLQTPDVRQIYLFIDRGFEQSAPVTDPSRPHPVAPDFHPPEWLGLTKELP